MLVWLNKRLNKLSNRLVITFNNEHAEIVLNNQYNWTNVLYFDLIWGLIGWLFVNFEGIVNKNIQISFWNDLLVYYSE